MMNPDLIQELPKLNYCEQGNKIFVKPGVYPLSSRKLEGFMKIANLQKYYQCNPVRFINDFFNIELLDAQAWVIQRAWNCPNVLLVCTRGFGKSTLIDIMIMAKDMLFNNYWTYIASGSGSQAEQTFTTLERLANDNIDTMLGSTGYIFKAGANAIIRRGVIARNEVIRKPVLYNDTGKRKIVIAYDPARSRDNSVILVCEIYSEKNQDGDLEYKMRLLNCINLIDISNKKKKKPMQTPAQIEYLKQVILDYNQGGDENYSNILGVYIDAGSGGGGVNIADYLMPDWKDKSGKTHRGLIDKEYSEEYVKKFPNAVNKLHLMEPTKYKSEMYEAMIEMMNQDKIEFTATYDNKGYLTIFDIDKDKYEKTKKDLIAKYKKQKMTDEEIDYNVQKELDKLQNVKSHIEKLNWQEEASLSSIDALKEELVNMIRIPRQSGKDSFELCPEKANRLHDDRAYVTCMCSYALQTERRKNITAKRKPKVDKSLVQKLTIRKGVVHSMFET